MIGGGVTPEGSNLRALPAAHDRRGPVAERRPRPVLALDASSAPKKPRPPKKRGGGRRSPASTSSARSTAPSTCRPTSPRSAGWSRASACEVNLVFPLGSHLDDVAAARRRRRQRLHVPRVRPPAVRGAGPALPAGARSACSRPRSSCARSANSPALDPEPFIEREKHTTHQADLGPVALASRRTSSPPPASPSSPPTPTRAACGTSSRTRWALPCTFAVSRRPGVKTDNEAVREALADKPPLVLFGCYNERMYAAEQRLRAAIYIPASFPGAIIRRAHRHALHGLRRRDLPRPGSTATRCSTRSSTSCRSAPTSTGSSRRRRARSTRSCAWDEEAQALLDGYARGPALPGADLGRQAAARPRRARGHARRARPGSPPRASRACSRRAWPREAQPRVTTGAPRPPGGTGGSRFDHGGS